MINKSALATLAVFLATSQVANASVIYGQCGGIGWTGDKTCTTAGTVCTYINDYYYQCLTGTATTTTTTTTTTTPPTSTTTPPTSTTTTTTASPTSSGSCATAATISGYSNTKLPNPFLFNDGTPVKTKADWTCRRAQISALIQGYEAGTLPPKPPVFSATFTKSGSTVTFAITAGTGSASVTFNQAVTIPSGTAPSGGWPLIIQYEGGSIPIPAGIATANYANSNIAQQNGATSSRGVGTFYNLYGKTHTASAMTAWVWGVSRIIDAIEANPSAGINPAKIAVTGCSRDGKGALMAGAFEERIALTIPQESGSGGDACWRLSKYEETSGSAVQTATEIVGENVWFSTNFKNYVNTLNVLPYDHHLLVAMVAPRGLISYENTDYLWLSGLSSYGCVTAAHTVYTALGVASNHGFEQVGGHSHCAWPTSLTPTLNAFFNRFLLGQNVTTNYWATNSVFNGVAWTPANWIDWTTPTLT